MKHFASHPALLPRRPNCTYTAPSGDYYDIAPIVQRGGDYEFMDTEQRYTYYWNSCRGVESRGSPGSEHHCGPYDAVCRNDPDDPNRFFSLGRLETVSFLETRPGFLVAGYQRGTGGRSVAIEIELVLLAMIAFGAACTGKIAVRWMRWARELRVWVEFDTMS